jgi:hypothetical protein
MDTISVLLEEWTGRFGDNDFLGWLITFCYVITVLASLHYIIILSRNQEPQKKTLWICITVFLLILGINKQLDLQTLFTITGRAVASAEGWLEYRRIIQEYFAIGIFSCIGLLGIIVLWYVRKILVASWLELMGTSILLVFVLIRTASISHINKAMRLEQGISHIHAIELLGLLIILAAIYFHIFRDKKQSMDS